MSYDICLSSRYLYSFVLTAEAIAAGWIEVGLCA